MNKRKLWLFGLMLLLVLSAALAACGSDDGKKEETGTKSESDGNETEVEKDVEKDVRDTLVFGRGGDSTSLDPSRVTEGESFKVTVNLYETLLNFGEEDTTIQPGLATEWAPSEDGLTYTFTLREGVKFHDGTDFNAEAVVKNFDRWANGDAEMFPYYNSMFGGFKDDPERVIDSVTAEGDNTVVIKLTRAQAPFLKILQ